jgi:hypothetical protein
LDQISDSEMSSPDREQVIREFVKL